MSIYKTILGQLQANNYRFFFIYTLLLSFASIGFAYFVEFILGFEPCYLCLYQRVPYYAMALISIAALASKHRKGFMFAMIITFISSVILAGYHSGIERGIFNPTDKCSPGDLIEKGMSMEEILASIYAAPLADCSKPAFKILGVSMTELNLILSVCLVIMSIIILSSAGRVSRSRGTK